MTSSILIDIESNLKWIAEQAGQAGMFGRYYKDGRLYVEGVTQAALDAAHAAYDPELNAPALAPSEFEVLRAALKAKGVLNDSDLEGARAAAIQEMSDDV